MKVDQRSHLPVVAAGQQGKGVGKRLMLHMHRWAQRCIKAHKGNKKQALFGIVQGGVWKNLREESAKFISSLPFDGYAIGGSLGDKSKTQMHDILDWTIPNLKGSKPIHLLGIGAVEDIFNSVERGVDTFDCVTPTRLARHGYIFLTPKAGGTLEGKYRISIKNKKFSVLGIILPLLNNFLIFEVAIPPAIWEKPVSAAISPAMAYAFSSP